ncbi:MAG: HPr family phosphocarrier protein [Bacteroidales bacterium]|nr:HPr family phosphocarrier protein [Bacteroidales bacterium]
MQTITHVIQDSLGIHARPAGLLVKTAAGFASDIRLTAKGKTVSLKSILGLMTLGLKQGDRMDITLDGPDEAEAAQALTAVLP